MKGSKSVVKASGPAKAGVKTVSKQASASLGPVASDRKWLAEDAMRTIMRAEEHKKDPKLMNEVKRLAKEQQAKLAGLCGKAK